MNKDLRKSLLDRLQFLEQNSAHLTVDADVHLTDLQNLSPALRARMQSTPDYFHGRPMDLALLLAEMAIAGVDAALCWQNPFATEYGQDPAQNYNALLQANAYIADCAGREPQKILPAGWTDPKALGVVGACRLAEQCVTELGFPIVKLNPAQNQFPIDSDSVMQVVEKIISLGAVPAFHYGADTEFTPASGLRRVAEEFRSSPIIAVHMGGGGAGYCQAEELYQQSRVLGLECPNVFFIFSAKRDCHIESDLIAYTLHGSEAAQRLAFGSDAPYGKITWNFAGARALLASLSDSLHPDPLLKQGRNLFTPAHCQQFLGGNIVRLYAAALHRILA